MKVISFAGHLINDGNEYVAGLTAESQSPPRAKAAFIRRNGVRPLVGALTFDGVLLTLLASLPTSGALTKRVRQTQLFQWFDNTSAEAQRLVVADDDGVNHLRYVMVVPIACVAVNRADGWQYEIVLAVHGDVRWRSVIMETDQWIITASGQTKTITNEGDDIALPVFRITPTASKSGSYAYKRWLPIKWGVETAVSGYPIDVLDVFDTAALVTAGKMQSGGNDLRIEVDGVEVDRWVSRMNTTTTKAWCNFDYAAQAVATLKVAMLIGDAVETLDVNEAVSGFPSSGILLVGSEAFTYTGKNDSLKRLTGVSRAQKGTAAAGHSVSAAVDWIQHDVWMIYGNSGAAAPTVDSDYEPSLDMAVTLNTYWQQSSPNFTLSPTRGGFWSFDNFDNTSAITETRTGVNRVVDGEQFRGRVKIYNPCGIISAQFSDGESDLSVYTSANIQSSVNGADWINEYAIPDGFWARTETLEAQSVYAALHMESSEEFSATDQYVSASEVYLTLNSSNTPDITVNAEQPNYQLAATITNETTNESILLTHTMGLGEALQVNTDLTTVKDLENGSNQFQALKLVEGVRLHWLKMLVGDNVFRFDDVGMAGVTLATEWEERRYS